MIKVTTVFSFPSSTLFAKLIYLAGKCVKVLLHDDEDAELFLNTRITQADIVVNSKICQYFNQSCTHPMPFSRRVFEEEENYSEHLRMQRNQKEGFKGDHDAPACAKSLKVLREYKRWSQLSAVSDTT